MRAAMEGVQRGYSQFQPPSAVLAKDRRTRGQYQQIARGKAKIKEMCFPVMIGLLAGAF